MCSCFTYKQYTAILLLYWIGSYWSLYVMCGVPDTDRIFNSNTWSPGHRSEISDPCLWSPGHRLEFSDPCNCLSSPQKFLNCVCTSEISDPCLWSTGTCMDWNFSSLSVEPKDISNPCMCTSEFLIWWFLSMEPRTMIGNFWSLTVEPPEFVIPVCAALDTSETHQWLCQWWRQYYNINTMNLLGN